MSTYPSLPSLWTNPLFLATYSPLPFLPSHFPLLPPPFHKGESSQAAALRAFHPDEVGKQEHLKVDTRYYLQHQLQAVVSRLCEPIEGLDAAQIAECLGEGVRK